MKKLTPTKVFFVFVLISSVLSSPQAVARDIEIEGVLVNKTITWFGQDFFYYFAREWRNQRFQGEGLVIEEKLSARRGTIVSIHYKGDVVYQASINATRSESRERGAKAVNHVLSRIQSIDLAAVGVGQVDLAGDGF